jgi:hypothetical protein
MSDPSAKQILERLHAEACGSTKPKVREATLNRLVEACDAIESGAAADLCRQVLGSDRGLRFNPQINPSTVALYVQARRAADPTWKGPGRVTNQRDPGLKAYIDAREDERRKPSPRQRPSDKVKRLEDAIAAVQSIEVRMELRHFLEAGRQAMRQLQMLRAGLTKIPGVDIEKLLLGHSEAAKQPLGGSVTTEGGLNLLSPAEQGLLRQLVERFTDVDEMGRCGLSAQTGRVKAIGSGTTIVRARELALLRRLASG